MKNEKLIIREVHENKQAIMFCKAFIDSSRPKYIFGRNEYAQSIINKVEIDGVVDDFTDETSFCDIPIVAIEDIPSNALVILVVVIGKPVKAEKRVSQFQFEYLSYYLFVKYSGLSLESIIFQDGMQDDIRLNYSKYKDIYCRLSDDISKNQFYNILNFRMSNDINFMRGFSPIEHLQYFEDFLGLEKEGEVFLDVGGYDGFTSEEFIKHCPNYKGVHIFEPEESNMISAKKNLDKYPNITYHQKGLFSKKETLKFNTNTSSSKISEDGEIVIYVDRLDDLISEKVTFIKMDIEGAEKEAIEGARETIKKYYPKLAISVYHQKDDFWKIPQLIFSIRDDYKIYLRHYTEGIAETVMFFVPIKK